MSWAGKNHTNRYCAGVVIIEALKIVMVYRVQEKRQPRDDAGHDENRCVSFTASSIHLTSNTSTWWDLRLMMVG